MCCVAEASSVSEAVDKAGLDRPDVAVLDLRMPDATGISATRRIVADAPNVGVLLLTMLDDEQSVIAALHAGARGYALKSSPAEDIISAIRAVGHGEAIFGQAVADRILALFADAPSAAVRTSCRSSTARRPRCERGTPDWECRTAPDATVHAPLWRRLGRERRLSRDT